MLISCYWIEPRSTAITTSAKATTMGLCFRRKSMVPSCVCKWRSWGKTTITQRSKRNRTKNKEGAALLVCRLSGTRITLVLYGRPPADAMLSRLLLRWWIHQMLSPRQRLLMSVDLVTGYRTSCETLDSHPSTTVGMFGRRVAQRELGRCSTRSVMTGGARDSIGLIVRFTHANVDLDRSAINLSDESWREERIR